MYNGNDRIDDLPLVAFQSLEAGSYIRCYSPTYGEVRVDATTIPLLRGVGPVALLGKSTGRTSRVSVAGAGDVTNQTLDYCDIPGNTLGENSKVLVHSAWTYPNSARQKVLIPKLGTQTLGQTSPTTSVTSVVQSTFWNLGSRSVQRIVNGTSWGQIDSANTLLSGTVNTAIDQRINFTCNWDAAATSETIWLESWFVLMIY